MEPLKERIAPRKIRTDIGPSKVKSDVERFQRMAIELGAEDAVVVSSDEIVVDERVRAKCIYPKCGFYGTNINCPPHASDLDFTRALIARYQYGILFCVKGDPKDFVGPDFLERVGGRNHAKTILHTVCSEVESRAFYEGYPFALALGQGPCKSFWCPDQPCAALEPGGKCRFALKARTSMEAIGIDAFTMAANVGWAIYPCGERAEPDRVPQVLLMGLILIT